MRGMAARRDTPMDNRRMTFNRLQHVMPRQDPPAWGADYQPGILATREEAPEPSRAAQLWSEKLQRYVHALSKPEQAAVRLALHHPRLFELQEQRMLPMDSRPHPLMGHPRAVGMHLPNMRGTIEVAQRLDLLAFHRWIKHRDLDSGDDKLVPIPFFGDLLLFLADEQGPYCVNWTIKDSEASFTRPFDLRRQVRNDAKDSAAERARHAIEEQLYLDVGIRTVRVVAESIPDRLDNNLRNLFLHQRRLNPIGADVERELEDRLRAGLRTGQPPQTVLLAVTHRHDLPYQDVRQAFFRILWQRRVKIELIDADVLVDQPLEAERNDLFARFGHLFNREA